jgi:hypothetical protein
MKGFNITEMVTIPLDLLKRLAPEDPMNQDEMGGCVWCGCGPPNEVTGYAGKSPEDHAGDCPWLEAQKYTG